MEEGRSEVWTDGGAKKMAQRRYPRKGCESHDYRVL